MANKGKELFTKDILPVNLKYPKYKPNKPPKIPKTIPKPPKICKGLLLNFLQNQTLIKSIKPFNILPNPYLVFPNFLLKCLTLTSEILNPFQFNKAGIYLCISPYKSISSKHSLLYAFKLQPESCIGSLINIPLNLFAILEKILFPKVSFLLALHPETTSNPSSIFSSNKGISSGSFCKSPSIVIIILPLLSLMPESIAAVCPKLVLCLTILTGFKLKRLTKVLSLLPSSTKIISYFFPILFKTETNFPCRILTFSSSLNTGITIEISIIF